MIFTAEINFDKYINKCYDKVWLRSDLIFFGDTMANALGHFKTITRHRHMVIKHCKKAGIFWQGLRHDLSKYSPAEFIPGAKYYLGTRSPNEAERNDIGYSTAWLHHKGRNRHHYEYWQDYNPKTKKMEPVEMPIKYFKELFCDRVAASKIYQGKNYTNAHPLEYFTRAKDRILIHENTKALLEKALTILAEQGEDTAFEFIRNLK